MIQYVDQQECEASPHCSPSVCPLSLCEYAENSQVCTFDLIHFALAVVHMLVHNADPHNTK